MTSKNFLLFIRSNENKQAVKAGRLQLIAQQPCHASFIISSLFNLHCSFQDNVLYWQTLSTSQALSQQLTFLFFDIKSLKGMNSSHFLLYPRTWLYPLLFSFSLFNSTIQEACSCPGWCVDLFLLIPNAPDCSGYIDDCPSCIFSNVFCITGSCIASYNPLDLCWCLPLK